MEEHKMLYMSKKLKSIENCLEIQVLYKKSPFNHYERNPLLSRTSFVSWELPLQKTPFVAVLDRLLWYSVLDFYWFYLLIVDIKICLISFVIVVNWLQ